VVSVFAHHEVECCHDKHSGGEHPCHSTVWETLVKVRIGEFTDVLAHF